MAQLLQTAPTSTGIYADHLRRYWVTLHNQPELALAVCAVISSTSPVQLEPITAYKLSSMGLIKLNSNRAIPSCQMYRQYIENQQLERQLHRTR